MDTLPEELLYLVTSKIIDSYTFGSFRATSQKIYWLCENWVDLWDKHHKHIVSQIFPEMSYRVLEEINNYSVVDKGRIIKNIILAKFIVILKIDE